MKYLVICDHPYYPEVDYFDDIEEAYKHAERKRKDMFDNDGSHKCIVSVCRVLQESSGKSYY